MSWSFYDSSGHLKTSGTAGPTGATGATGPAGTTGPAGPSTVNTGSAQLNFGAFPGASDALIAVTGQTLFVAASSIVHVGIAAVATTDHAADEHWVESLDVTAGNYLDGVGFTIYGINTNTLFESVPPQVPLLIGVRGGKPDLQPRAAQGGSGTLIYGKWTVNWMWV